MRLWLSALALFAASISASAQAPLPVPEISVIVLADGRLQEFRINDRLYMVKVAPHKGLAYYLVDTEGDGRLDTRFNDLDPGLMIPGWVLVLEN